MNKLYASVEYVCTKAYHNHVQGIEIIVQTVIGWCVMCVCTESAQLQSTR